MGFISTRGHLLVEQQQQQSGQDKFSNSKGFAFCVQVVEGAWTCSMCGVVLKYAEL